MASCELERHLLQGIGEVVSVSPVKLKVIDELVTLAVGFLRSRDGVVPAHDLVVRDLQATEAEVVIAIPLKGDLVAALVLEHDGGDHLLAVDLHDVVEVMVSPGPDDQIRSDRFIVEALGEALVVVDMSCEDDVGVAASGGIHRRLERLLHVGATRVVIVGGIDGVMQC